MQLFVWLLLEKNATFSFFFKSWEYGFHVSVFLLSLLLKIRYLIRCWIWHSVEIMNCQRQILTKYKLSDRKLSAEQEDRKSQGSHEEKEYVITVWQVRRKQSILQWSQEHFNQYPLYPDFSELNVISKQTRSNQGAAPPPQYILYIQHSLSIQHILFSLFLLNVL